jgi:cytochrome c
MKKPLIAALLAASELLAFGAAQADEAKANEALAKEKGCMACHRLDAKMVGPAYREVARKYSDKDVDMLVDKVLNGSDGVWGPVMMTPNKATVSREDATTLVKWILTLK